MRKNIAWAVVCLLVSIGMVACGGGGGGSTTTTNADVNGYWKLDFSDGETAYMSLSQTGTGVTGQGYCVDSWDGVTITGSVNGNSLSLQGSFGASTYPFSGTVNGSSIQSGTFSGRPGSRRASLTWTGAKQAQAPTGKECVIASLDIYSEFAWNVGAHMYDVNALLVQSATISGSNLSSAQTFTFIDNSSPSVSLRNKWYVSSNLTGSPSFPLNYTVNITFKDSTSQLVSRAVTTFEP